VTEFISCIQNEYFFSTKASDLEVLEDEQVVGYLSAAAETCTLEEFLQVVSGFLPDWDTSKIDLVLFELRYKQMQEGADSHAAFGSNTDKVVETGPSSEKQTEERVCSKGKKQLSKVERLLSICPPAIEKKMALYILAEVCDNDLNSASEYILNNGAEKVISDYTKRVKAQGARQTEKLGKAKKPRSKRREKKQETLQNDPNTVSVAPSEQSKYSRKGSNLDELLVICPPTMNIDAVKYVLTEVCGNRVDKAAEYIFDKGVDEVEVEYKRKLELASQAQLEMAAKDAAQEARVKKQLLNRFDEFAVDAKGSKDKGSNEKQARKTVRRLKKQEQKERQEKQYRYFDGQVVSRTGQKYVSVETKPEWNGGSKGRVITKGKRGPGWVAG